MVRSTGVAMAVAGLLALVAGFAPSPASAADPCTGGEQECGVPSCWSPSVRVRPDMPRVVRVSCQRVVSAKVVGQPATA